MLRVFDVTEPHRPTVLSVTPLDVPPSELWVEGDVLWAKALDDDDGSEHIVRFDVSDAGAPIQVDGTKMDGSVLTLGVADGLVLANMRNAGLLVIAPPPTPPAPTPRPVLLPWLER